MTANGWLQIGVTFVLTFLLGWPLGRYMASVYQGEPHPLERLLGPPERALYRLAGTEPTREQSWGDYAKAMLAFNALGLLFVWGLQMVQHWLPLNPAGMGPVSWHSAFNTAVSFATNTNWQGYGGESTMSYLTQMLGLAVQNFVSAASGMATGAALARGLARKAVPGAVPTVGNYWADLVRGTLYVLLPLSFVVALILVSQGVVQTFSPYVVAQTLQGGEQTIAVGPAASQVAIKQLGTNGGGFFNVNSAHPLENSTPLSNLVETISILVIGVGFCRTYGRMVGDERQGRGLVLAMTLILVPLVVLCAWAEGSGNPVLTALGADPSGGNMEGKEVRFGIAPSALWAAFTTAASNGSVNSMHDSFTPLGGLVPMWLIQLGEVVFGGVGSGLYGMVLFALVAVFVAGLMVGRTPEYLGKKVEAYEMKMAAIGILAPCATVLLGAALSVMTTGGTATIFNPGTHGYSEVLYAWSSASNNNGSAFAGLGANTVFYDLGLGTAMLVGRYAVAVPVLAIAGSMGGKKSVAAGPGTLPTHDVLFVVLLVATVLLVGALTFLPALALGPIVEHFTLSVGGNP
jgi:K+-transporting ATPase ATPase A chain